MDLSSITPLILTFNEAPNIGRTLERLRWADHVLIIDSYSTDQTLEIARQFPNVAIVQRPFDHFAEQCNFGLQHVKTPWTLSLDADYVLSSDLPQELSQLESNLNGYRCEFRYCVHGYPLRSTLYPPRVVLYQTQKANYVRDGHAHRVMIDGSIGMLQSKIDHDDRKPLPSWFAAQAKYAAWEAIKLSGSKSPIGWKDWIRKHTWCAPILSVIYCLFAKGLILDGRPGWFYTFQRSLAELMLTIAMLDRRLSQHCDGNTASSSE